MQSESWGAAPPDIQADDLRELCRLCRRSPHFATIRSWGTSTSSTPRKEKRSFTEYFGGSRNPWLETDCDRPPTHVARTVINSSCGQWELSRNPFNILGEQSQTPPPHSGWLDELGRLEDGWS